MFADTAADREVAGCLMALVFLALYAALFGGVGAMIGSWRGNAIIGFLSGVLLGPIGWLAMALSDYRPRCPQCRGRCDAKAVRCMHCGVIFREVLPAPKPPMPKPASVQQPPPRPRCPCCRNPVDPAWAVCPICATPLKAPAIAPPRPPEMRSPAVPPACPGPAKKPLWKGPPPADFDSIVDAEVKDAKAWSQTRPDLR